MYFDTKIGRKHEMCKLATAELGDGIRRNGEYGECG